MALAWICSCFTGLQVERNKSLGQEDALRAVKGRVYLEIKEQPAGDFRGVLQQALCSASQERLVERRAKALVQTLYNHLGAQAVVRLYGVTDEGGDRLSLVLLSSASNSGRESEDERSGSHIPLAPAQKRAGPLAHLQDMMHTALAYKAPVTRRGPDTAAVAVALPLLLGQNVGGALWIQQPGTTASATAAAAISALAVNPAGHLHSPRDLDLDLEHLALSASILLSAGAPDAAQHLADLSSALRRLADSTTLKALVSELCAILAAHVRRNFLLDAVVRAAIVPVAGAQVGFLLEDDSPSARWGGGGPASGAAVLPGPVALAAAALLASASADPGGGGGDSMYGGGGGAAATGLSGSCLANSGSHSAGVAPKVDALGSRGRRGSCLEGNGPLHGPAPAAAASGNAGAAALGGVRRSSSEVNLARAARTALFHNLPRPMGHLAPAPHTLDATPASGRGRTSRCPTAGQMGGHLLSPPGRPSTGLGMGPVLDPVAMSLGFNTAVPLAALRARPVRLSDTLLNAMMQRGACATTSAAAAAATAAGGEAAAAATLRDGEQSNVDGGGVEGGSGGGRVLVGDVVADCLQYVQCIRLPSRDVYMLLNMMGGGGGGRDTTTGLYDSTGASASQASSTRGRYTVLGLTAPAATVAPAASQQPPASGGGVRSLALLGVATEGGQVLGVYVSFPTTLPRHMLLAVRDSCADLLDAVLAAQVRHKLREQCASEIETLAAGVPGNYVIMPSGKIPEVASGGGGGGAQAVGANSGGGCGGAAAAVTACVSIIRRQHSQLHQLLEDERPSPLLSESLPEMPRTMLSPNAGSTAATVPSVGLLGGTAAAVWNTDGAPSAAGPTAAASFRLAHRAAGGASPGRSHSALHLRHRSLSLWEAGSGDTGSHAVTTSGAHATTQGFSRGGGPTSGQGTSAMLAASTGNFAALRRDGAGVAEAEAALPGGGMETVSNDAALLTLLGADCGEGAARAQLCLLVESVMSTLRDSAVAPGIEDLYDMSSFDVKTGGVGGGGVFRPLHDDMDELVLTTMVGTGASGVVLMGQLATVPVAVKLMELPPGAFSEGGAAAGAAGNGDGSATTGSHPRKSSDVIAATSSIGANTSGSGGGWPPPPQQQQQKRRRHADAQRRFDARRSLLRSATELAVLRSVSHINIVQVYAVYSNVALNRITNDQGEISYKLQYRRGGEAHNTQDPDECPPCVAVCMEFADVGSLEGVLTQRTFPRWMPQQQQPQDRRNGGAAPQGEATLQVDLKGVYLTLLEIALALRHLHSRRLAHRDVKPANILLKSNPSDPRGWNCKLADFGFAIVLDQQQPLESGSGLGFFALQEQACGTVTHMAPEALQVGARIDASVDIFSLGIIMWELVAGRGYRPYTHMEQQDIPPAVRGGMRPIFPEGLVPAQYSTMAQACWSAEPHKRPTAADVVSFAKEQLEQLSAQAAMRRRHAHAAATAAATGGAGA